jgi:hypothetical protein
MKPILVIFLQMVTPVSFPLLIPRQTFELMTRQPQMNNCKTTIRMI